MIVDLFAGPGGWDQGIAQAGRTDVLGFEKDADACATAEKAGHRREQADLGNYDYNGLKNVEGLVASPPCQGFSLAGKKIGKDADSVRILDYLRQGVFPAQNQLQDPRSFLVTVPLQWAIDLRPRWLAFEQVNAVLPLWEVMAERLKKYGYFTWTGVLRAEEYGVPQVRKRAYLLASLDHEVNAPTPTHSRYNAWHPEKLTHQQRWVSMADALGWDPNDLVGFPRKADGLDAGTEYRERDLRRSEYPANTVTSKSRSWERFVSPEKAADLEWPFKRPSPTIVGSFRPDIVAAPGYRKAGDGPRQNQPGSVRVTQQEAAILQSFPPDYPWQGSRTAQFRQIGDAVPPGVAQRVVEHLWV